MGKEYTEAQARATRKYQEKFATVKFRTTQENKERYTKIARESNTSLNTYILEALDEKAGDIV